jgi:hypothetical protein
MRTHHEHQSRNAATTRTRPQASLWFALCFTLCACFVPARAIAASVTLPHTIDLNIHAGKFAEICVALKKGARIAYRFNASQPLKFNVHYHVGSGRDEKVIYLVDAKDVNAQESVLVAPIDQHFCWMWTNPTTSTAKITGELK